MNIMQNNKNDLEPDSTPVSVSSINAILSVTHGGTIHIHIN